MAFHFSFFFFFRGHACVCCGSSSVPALYIGARQKECRLWSPLCELVPAHPFTAIRGEEVGSWVWSLSTAKYTSALEQSSPWSLKQPTARQHWPKCAKCATRERLSTYRCEGNFGLGTYTHSETGGETLMISTPHIYTFLMWPTGW